MTLAFTYCQLITEGFIVTKSDFHSYNRKLILFLRIE